MGGHGGVHDDLSGEEHRDPCPEGAPRTERLARVDTQRDDQRCPSGEDEHHTGDAVICRRPDQWEVLVDERHLPWPAAGPAAPGPAGISYDGETDTDLIVGVTQPADDSAPRLR
jgi:hypothetical protein